jgi:hypothetical protein
MSNEQRRQAKATEHAARPRKADRIGQDDAKEAARDLEGSEPNNEKKLSGLWSGFTQLHNHQLSSRK